jgi:MOSC domain-containing protein YiiM
MALSAGNVGENVTLQGITEENINAGDIIRLGTALLQVSGPRVPCANLALRIGRPDWVRLTMVPHRTGFYMPVLEPGKVQAGDCWELRQRLNEGRSIPAINRCVYTDFHAECAARLLQMDGLDDWWKLQVLEKLHTPTEHRTAKITQ